MTTKNRRAKANSLLLTDPAVKNALREIKQALSTLSKHDVPARYQIGAKVHDLRSSASEQKYGKRAVATIAREVGLTAACLYQYADVARTWNSETFEDVGRRAATAGLMFSHFIELAHADHAAGREGLLKRAIDEKLSVRQLRRLRTKPVPNALERVKKEAGTSDVLERLKSEGPSDELRAMLDEALKQERQALCVLEERIHALELAKQGYESAGLAALHVMDSHDEKGGGVMVPRKNGASCRRAPGSQTKASRTRAAPPNGTSRSTRTSPSLSRSFADVAPVAKKAGSRRQRPHGRERRSALS